MDKRVDYIYGDHNSSVLTLIHPGHLTKTAEISEELQQFVKDLKRKVDVTYALVNALSAGEYYGSNRNGDYFPEQALLAYHKTFEALGGIYKHHINKDSTLSMGKIIFSHYNPVMHRVELILELDNRKASPVISALEKGELPAVSMGCRVPYDVCSICGNRAKTRALYCDHLRNQMNETLSDGRKVYAINTMPKFFDISVVTIPAERTAGFIRRLLVGEVDKVASYNTNHLSLDKFLEKTANFDTLANINKIINGQVEAASPDPNKLVLLSQKKFSKEQIEKLSTFPFNDVLSTMLALRVIPHREDFQKLSLYSLGYKKEADELESLGYVFDVTKNTVPEDIPGVNISNYNEKIAEVFKDDLWEMSNTKPLILGRILTKYSLYNEGQQNLFVNPAKQFYNKTIEPSLFDKVFGKKESPTTSPIKNPGLAMGALGALYMGFSKLHNTTNVGEFTQFLLKYPWLAPLFLATIGGSVATSFQEANYRKSPLYEDHLIKKGGLNQYVKNTLIAVPPSYYLSYKAEAKAQQGIPITGIENFVRKHPLLVSYITGIGGTKLYHSVKNPAFLKDVKDLFKGHTKISSVIGRLDSDIIDQLYYELITWRN